MTMMEASAVLLQLLLPLALVVRVGLVRERTRLSWGLDVALAGSYLAAITLAAPWLVLPWYLPWILVALLAVAAAVGGRRADAEASGSRRLTLLGHGLRAVLVLLFLGLTVLALSGRDDFGQDPVDLASPLRQGTYIVVNGGSSEIINPHLKTLTAERFRSYRGQSYALDVVKVGSWGSRSHGLSPDSPDGFAIFGDTLHAPCSGSVTRAVDGTPDRLDPGQEPASLEGNHVILDCDGIRVVLAHIQRGTVSVDQGARLEVGEPLGRVGNSGRSDEPHLHIHAQTPGTEAAPLGGDPVPITIDGRHLVRNSRFR